MSTPVPLDGVFELRTPTDLRHKLEADFARLVAAPSGSKEAQHAAFDFLVTAEHIPDWLERHTKVSKSSNRAYPDGAAASHIANGAKHFHVEGRQHAKSSVLSTSVSQRAFSSAFQQNAFQSSRITVERSDGSRENVIDLCQRILDHWRRRLP
jgi:hypothetical protein